MSATAFTWTVCSLIAVMFLLPLVALLVTVIKSPEAAAASPPAYLPDGVSTENFAALTESRAGLWRYVANTFLVSCGTVLLTVVVATLAGYGFARFRFPLREPLFVTVLLCMMIPFQAILTPLYMVLRSLHLQNSLIGLVFVYATFQLPISVFLMRNSFQQIPETLPESAQIDGCSSLSALWRVLLPVVRPGAVSVALFAFFSAWNEFLAALVLLSDEAKFTLPIFLSALASGQLGSINWGVLEAGVLVTMVPCAVIFLILQRYYVRGLVAGSVK
ncbi:carbohydrate ABC transporter permease [Streptomyces radicis]|uniref:Carbohydrate ABC transporter permease n=1 Tax=Streptomyces radicis TaxID=1750517 RepID=A0A3A9VQW5_9ACTN|nr:carbohydrate ABC transporter permease [Streptomyces radicis]RKN03149.1 carbohydrate ABC transporter permease [Streptomyces radicis]RKN13066.1 carbohydrate ABC transporter permease [Streptomyces radicis]